MGWHADAAQVVAQLRARDLLPTGLAGWRVVWLGLGATAGDQPPLPFPARAALESYWRAIRAAAGAAACTFDDTRPDEVPSGATAEMPLVAVDGVSSVVGPRGEVSATLSDEVLGFRGDSAAITADGVELVDRIAGRAAGAGLEESGASVSVTGFCAVPPGSSPAGLVQLSLARARAVAGVLEAALARRGVPVQVHALGGGVAAGTTAMVDGVFVESIAATMRRVVSSGGPTRACGRSSASWEPVPWPHVAALSWAGSTTGDVRHGRGSEQSFTALAEVRRAGPAR